MLELIIFINPSIHVDRMSFPKHPVMLGGSLLVYTNSLPVVGCLFVMNNLYASLVYRLKCLILAVRVLFRYIKLGIHRRRLYAGYAIYYE